MPGLFRNPFSLVILHWFLLSLMLLLTQPFTSEAQNGNPHKKTSDSILAFYPTGAKQPIKITVEVPSTPEQFAQGLMFRKSLPKKHGMLFIFPQTKILRFWMHETYLPLDMIFLDETCHVVWIEESATPLDDTPRGPNVPARYVVEVNAGFAKQHQIQQGTQMKPVSFSSEIRKSMVCKKS